MFLQDFYVCDHLCHCVCFLCWVFFLLFVCFILFLYIFSLFDFNAIPYVPVCFLIRDRKGVDSMGEEMVRNLGGKIVIRMYCMKNLFTIK